VQGLLRRALHAASPALAQGLRTVLDGFHQQKAAKVRDGKKKVANRDAKVRHGATEKGP
jgi:hypothetical protein